jgi:hypothetical protein
MARHLLGSAKLNSRETKIAVHLEELLWVVDLLSVGCTAYRAREKGWLPTLAESRALLTSSWHLEVFGRDEVDIMTERLELTADVMGAGTSLHADQAGWDAREARRAPNPGELVAEHDGTALILTDEMEAVLAQIDAESGNQSRRGEA